MKTYHVDSEESLLDFNTAIRDKSIVIDKFISATELTAFYEGELSLFSIEQQFILRVNFSLDDTTKLIFGKSPLDRIVNISYKNDNVHIFRELEDGKVQENIIPYTFWILNSLPKDNDLSLSGRNPLRYLQEFDSEDSYKETIENLWGKNSFIIHSTPEAFMTRHGYTYFKGITPSDISYLSFDIETSGLDKHADNAKVFLITNFYRYKDKTEKKTFNVDDYSSDKEMIADWCSWVRQINPSFLVCHNGIIFDLPYLFERSGQSLMLGRDGSNIQIEKKIREKRKDGSQSYSYQRITIFGREVIDTFFLSLTYDVQRKFESYALKTLVREIGLEKPGRTFVDASKIAHYWKEGGDNKAKVITYAEEDAEDSLKLFDKFSPSLFYFTQGVPKTFQLILETATGGQLNSILVRAYLQNNESIPKPFNIENEYVEGGISFSIPGIYKHLYKLDIKSAYPSQIVRLKLYNRNKDPRGYFYELVKYYMYKRFEYKELEERTGERIWKDRNEAGKIVINSAYGLTNTKGLNFNDANLAKIITKETRELIDLALRWATGHPYRHWVTKFYEKMEVKEEERKYLTVDSSLSTNIQYDYIAGPCDTDSISFCKQDNSSFTEEELKTLTKQINDLSPEHITWSDDGYYPRCLSFKAKNYVLKKKDGTYVKKGSALKSSKLEPILKELLDELIKDALENEGNSFQDIYKKYIKIALNPPDITKWCQKKTVTKPILACQDNSDVRKNEMDIWKAIEGKQKQEGDKIYLYPTIIGYDDITTTYKNGKQVVKKIPITGLKCVEDYKNDVNVLKLVDRVYDTVVLFKGIVGKNYFIDYNLVKNRVLLDDL